MGAENNWIQRKGPARALSQLRISAHGKWRVTRNTDTFHCAKSIKDPFCDATTKEETNCGLTLTSEALRDLVVGIGVERKIIGTKMIGSDDLIKNGARPAAFDNGQLSKDTRLGYN